MKESIVDDLPVIDISQETEIETMSSVEVALLSSVLKNVESVRNEIQSLRTVIRDSVH